ncbi:hypothetical protein L3X38_040683 [Prunus dulcis]|uniref:Uncharacterized protein n=1 Tax=Prunus dulcis TaxID=3755 RepID=A0AAD4V9J1_PRUDU|nr:hypothetical protein L3X38_040683 [Prunus dulcis]
MDSGFDRISFPQKAVKGQAVAEFLADHPGKEIENMDSLDIENVDLLTRVHTCLNNPIYSVHLTPWKLYFDGSKTDVAFRAGIFLEEPLGIKHCYSFTKWVEAKPVKSTTAQEIITFIEEQIMQRFGIP